MASGPPVVSLFSEAQLIQPVANAVPLTTFDALPPSVTGGVRVGVTLGFNSAGNFIPLVLVGAGPGGSGQIEEYDGPALFAAAGVVANPVPVNFLGLSPPARTNGGFVSVT